MDKPTAVLIPSGTLVFYLETAEYMGLDEVYESGNRFTAWLKRHPEKDYPARRPSKDIPISERSIEIGELDKDNEHCFLTLRYDEGGYFHIRDFYLADLAYWIENKRYGSIHYEVFKSQGGVNPIWELKPIKWGND